MVVKWATKGEVVWEESGGENKIFCKQTWRAKQTDGLKRKKDLCIIAGWLKACPNMSLQICYISSLTPPRNATPHHHPLTPQSFTPSFHLILRSTDFSLTLQATPRQAAAATLCVCVCVYKCMELKVHLSIQRPSFPLHCPISLFSRLFPELTVTLWLLTNFPATFWQTPNVFFVFFCAEGECSRKNAKNIGIENTLTFSPLETARG